MLAPLKSQATLVVDPTDPLAYPTITSAVGASSVGDTILVRGVVSNGVPNAYEDADGEVFPIHADGRSIIADPQTSPVYLARTVVSNTAFFEIQGSSGSPPPTLIKGFYLVGGAIGCTVSLQSGETTALELESLKFVLNDTGLDLKVENGAQVGFLSGTYCQVRDCLIVDSNTASAFFPAAVLGTPKHGIRAYISRTSAEDNDGGRLYAEVINLRTSGEGSGLDVESALVSVTVEESQDFREHAGRQTTKTPIRNIANAILDIQGGVLDGMAGSVSSANGWGVGIDAYTQYTGPAVEDYSYNAALEVRLTGTKLTGFRKNGVVLYSHRYCRAHLVLSGNSNVEWTGKQHHPDTTPNFPGDPQEGCGIFLDSMEGFLTFHSRNSTVSDNWWNGIYAHAASLPYHHSGTPWGVYFDMEDTGVHYNKKDGIYLKSGHRGVVGGAYFFDLQENKILGSNGTHVLRETGTPYPLPGGQGRINRCSISNNGSAPGFVGRGIVFDLYGQGDDAKECAIAAQVSNCMVWNNAGEGVLYDFSGDYQGMSYKGTIAAPVIHCTLAGNGGSGSQLIPSQTTRSLEALNWASGQFEWSQSVADGTEVFQSKILHSILYGGSVADPVLGMDLVASGRAGADSAPGQTGVGGNLLMMGNRTSSHQDDDYLENTWANSPGAGWWTTASPAFVGIGGSGSLDLLSRDPTQFFLISGAGLGIDFGRTPFFVGAFSPGADLDFDFQPTIRPMLDPGFFPNYSERDKGAHQG